MGLFGVVLDGAVQMESTAAKLRSRRNCVNNILVGHGKVMTYFLAILVTLEKVLEARHSHDLRVNRYVLFNCLDDWYVPNLCRNKELGFFLQLCHQLYM